MPPQAATMRSRWTAYAALSAVLAGGVVLKALAQRPNFYSAAVYLSQSSANLMILCNLVFVTASSALLLLQKLLYGPLRPIEVEQLYEKAWFAVTETCLAMTIFRGEIGAWFLVMFFSLLAGKVWGWIGEGRVEVLEQQQHNMQQGRSAGLFHMRLALSLGLGVLFDLSMLEYVVGQVLHMPRPDMLVMFGFEFAVLTITSLSTATRYALNLIEIGIVRGQKQKRAAAIRNERIDNAVRELQARQPQQTESTGDADAAQPAQPLPNARQAEERVRAVAAAAAQPIDEADIEVEGWEAKGRWVFYLDLATDFCKLVVYLSFFFILLIFYGLPLHIMRDVFLTCRSFFKRIGDFMRYRTATRDMNERYPDATDADFGREDVCIICREEMRPYVPPAQGQPTDPMAERMRPKKLPCGHVLHFSCLRSWLERQQICPTCRATVVPTPQPRPAAGAQGAAGRGQHGRNPGNGGPRVYQFGPLRIGVGAARGNNMFEELEQQLANLNPPPAQGQNGNAPQQYGFGIRWDGMRRRGQGQHRQARGTGQEMLEAAERQIQREIDSLQASMSELQALRNVQAQLARIRLARQDGQQQPQPGTQAAALPNQQLRPALPTMTALTPNQQQNILHSGSDQLPQGLTLPEGWTMMPLQPMQQHQHIPVVFPAPPMPNMPNMPNLGQVQTGGMIVQGMPVQRQQTVQPDSASPVTPDVQSLADERTRLAEQRTRLQAEHRELLAARSRLEATQTQLRSQLGELTGELRREMDSITSTGVNGGPATGSSNQPTNTQTLTRPTPVQAQQAQPRSPQPQTQLPPPSQLPPSQQPVPPTSSRPVPSPRPIPTPSTASTLNSSSSINPPQRLASTSASTPTNGVNGARKPSPHRPAKSIGSSWGFPSVEDTDDNEQNDKRPQTQRKSSSDEDDDSDEESESDEDRPKRSVGVKPPSQTASPQVKGKLPMVGDDDDDDSDEPD
ncbi:E3 ubiquitin-protein ligase hrd1 [Neophaeococcomyces mojaviensis]|uniref:E3 ubiquitin-protein ligase hrd1 n=1 Tax=Neophaeococcomyces mojaviensis TaxID=3383035 RepID=A0ACC3AFZ8_9EURO|nr:E3 ubiquitin-protein ligase hrd1 [Knufia sp. JES_112]